MTDPQAIRVILDANILVSYLLPSTKQRPITAIVEAAVEGQFSLLLPTELLAEFTRKVTIKRYLTERLTQQDAAELLELLVSISEAIAPISETVPPVSRGAKDDYLLACALLGEADYLVTGDDDLLTLGQVDDLQIVGPAHFLKTLTGL